MRAHCDAARAHIVTHDGGLFVGRFEVEIIRREPLVALVHDFVSEEECQMLRDRSGDPDKMGPVTRAAFTCACPVVDAIVTVGTAGEARCRLP